MATFGTPVSQGNDAQNAFNCAREMQIAMRQWAKERTEAKLPVIKHRIGIHFGNCIVGNVGNDDLKEFGGLKHLKNLLSVPIYVIPCPTRLGGVIEEERKW